MPTKRDVQKNKGPLAPFFDEGGLSTNPFGENASAERLYMRTERVVAALHLLTNHLETNEPTRLLARRSGLEILKAALALRDGLRAEGSRHMDSFRASIRYAISIVRMLAVSGLASSQNVLTLIAALDELGNFAAVSKRSPLSEGVVLSRDDLLDVGSTTKSLTDIKDKTIVKDNISSDMTVSPSVSENPRLEQNVRQRAILDVLRTTGRELGIRDIALNTPEYSEKMVQRELATLVRAGAVRKVGFKRWSKYALVF